MHHQADRAPNDSLERLQPLLPPYCDDQGCKASWQYTNSMHALQTRNMGCCHAFVIQIMPLFTVVM